MRRGVGSEPAGSGWPVRMDRAGCGGRAAASAFGYWLEGRGSADRGESRRR